MSRHPKLELLLGFLPELPDPKPPPHDKRVAPGAALSRDMGRRLAPGLPAFDPTQVLPAFDPTQVLQPIQDDNFLRQFVTVIQDVERPPVLFKHISADPLTHPLPTTAYTTIRMSVAHQEIQMMRQPEDVLRYLADMYRAMYRAIWRELHNRYEALVWQASERETTYSISSVLSDTASSRGFVLATPVWLHQNEMTQTVSLRFEMLATNRLIIVNSGGPIEGALYTTNLGRRVSSDFRLQSMPNLRDRAIDFHMDVHNEFHLTEPFYRIHGSDF